LKVLDAETIGKMAGPKVSQMHAALGALLRDDGTGVEGNKSVKAAALSASIAEYLPQTQL
tara:strand:- start:29 stop:208 length:180 start_codon:yes stop_codon:yes gene_type:complete